MNILGLIISCISILISTVIACNNFPRNINVGFDYQGVIVAIFSLLVTILIGWNIYNVIEQKGDIVKLKEYTETQTKYLQGAKSEIGYTLGLINMTRNYPVAFANFNNALYADLLNNGEKAEDIMQAMELLIENMNDRTTLDGKTENNIKEIEQLIKEKVEYNYFQSRYNTIINNFFNKTISDNK